MDDFKLNKYTVLSIAFLIILINIIIGHFFAPFGVLLSPIMTIIAAIVIFLNKDKFDIIFQAVLMFALVALNDVGIKLYGGGIHDSEGQGFVNLFFIICLVACFIILSRSVIKDKSTIWKKIMSILSFLMLVTLHLYFFGLLGLQQSYI
jgi:hypothetical protein